MNVASRVWLGVVVFLMLITLLLMAVVWYFNRGQLYRSVAATLTAELRAAKKEGLPLNPDDLERNPPVSDEQNAAPLYVKLIAASAALKDEQATIDVAAGRGTAAQKRSTEHLLATAAPQLRLVERATALQACDFHRNWSLGSDLLLPEYGPMRKMARLLAAKAALQSEAGHPEEALRTIQLGARMGRHSGEDPILMALLVHIAIESIMDRPLQGIIKRYADRPEILRLAESTDREFGENPDLRRAMGGEIVMCRIVAAEVRNERSRVTVTATTVSTGTTQSTAADAYEAHSISFWRRIFAALDRGGKDPMAVWVAAKAVNDAEETRSTDAAGNAKPTYEMDAVLSPYFSGAAEKIVEVETRRRLRRTLIVLLQHRAQHQRFPDALTLLSPSPRADPFVGKPLHYRTTNRGFKLYSVGRNLVDDGGNGTPRKKGDAPPDLVTAFP